MAASSTAGARWLATRGRPGVVAGVVAVAVALAAGLVLWVTRPGPLTAGPLDVAAGNAQSNSIGVHAGKPITWGQTEVVNGGHGTAVIDRITIPSKTPRFVRDVTIIDANAATGGVWGMITSYPPPYLPNSQQPSGAHLLPGRVYSVTVELIPPRNGRFQAGPVTFDYHIGSHRYRATDQSYGVVCAPRSRADHCRSALDEP